MTRHANTASKAVGEIERLLDSMKTEEVMATQLEAVFQGGVLRLLQPLGLLEDQKVSLTITTLPAAFG